MLAVHRSPRYLTPFHALTGVEADALALPWTMLDLLRGPTQLWQSPHRHLVRQVVDKDSVGVHGLSVC